jgi:hypothetical protein
MRILYNVSSSILTSKNSGTFNIFIVQIVHGLVDKNENELEEVERTLPNWLEANKIYGHFNGSPINFEG